MAQQDKREQDPSLKKPGAIKMGALFLLTLLLCGHQSLFFKPKIIRQFILVWESFDTALPAYTLYGLMLVQHPAGPLLPAASLALGAWGALQHSHLRSALAMAGVLLVTLALAGAFYWPTLMGG